MNKFKATPHKHERPCPCAGNSIARSEGELVIEVIRTSFNIQEDLPYCIWGTSYLNTNSYPVILQPYLPAGVTVMSITDNNVLTLVYTDAFFNSDTIIIKVPDTSLISYFEILASLSTNYMRSELILFNCNAAIRPPVLSQEQINKLKQPGLYFQRIGGINSKSNEVIIPYTRNMINNTTPQITEISLNNKAVKPDSVWVHSFAYTLLGGAITQLRFYWEIIVNERIDANEEAKKILEANKS